MGRGGAGFPTGRKIASVTGRKPLVIGNGAEGEPLSGKDASLMARAPHLVLDGLQVAAEAVGAGKIYVYLPNHVAPIARFAIDERSAAGLDRRKVTVVEATLLTILASLVFMLAAYELNWVCFVLSPVALAIVFFYSLTKRFWL